MSVRERAFGLPLSSAFCSRSRPAFVFVCAIDRATAFAFLSARASDNGYYDKAARPAVVGVFSPSPLAVAHALALSSVSVALTCFLTSSSANLAPRYDRVTFGDMMIPSCHIDYREAVQVLIVQGASENTAEAALLPHRFVLGHSRCVLRSVLERFCLQLAAEREAFGIRVDALGEVTSDG